MTGEEASNEDTPLQAAMRRALEVGSLAGPQDKNRKARCKARLLELIGPEVVARLQELGPGRELWVKGFDIANVLACERRYVAELEIPFVETVRRARGRVSGEMLKRWAFRDPRLFGRPWDPLLEIHELLDDLATEDSSLGNFIANLSEGGRADLAAEALRTALPLEESWPADLSLRPIQARVSQFVRLTPGLALRDTVTMRLGRPVGQGGEMYSSAVLLDVRAGHSFEEEERPNRWYHGLMELLATGVVPARVVTWYAEEQAAVAEHLDDDMLEAAMRRVADAVIRTMDLRDGEREPSVLPGWRCQYCSLINDCGQGSVWMSRRGSSAADPVIER